MTTNLPLSPAVKLLTDARKLLEEEGWCQHRLADSNGRLCLYGALNKADHGHYAWMGTPPNLDAQRALLRVTGTSSEMALIFWNNAPERTKEDVLNAFTSAIALLLGVSR